MVVIVLYVLGFLAVVIFLTNEADKLYLCLFRVKKKKKSTFKKFKNVLCYVHKEIN